MHDRVSRCGGHLPTLRDRRLFDKPSGQDTNLNHLVSATKLLDWIAEASNSIAQIEFYFSEFARSMSSIASSLNGIGMVLGNILASCIMNMIDYLTKSRGNESWISSNINEGHYDYYYLVLARLRVVNMLYFFVCRRAYGPLKKERSPGEQ